MVVSRAAQALAPRAQQSRGHAGFRGALERYVAGVNSRGRPEGRPYPWSQQAIHELSGLGLAHWGQPVESLQPQVGCLPHKELPNPLTK